MIRLILLLQKRHQNHQEGLLIEGTVSPSSLTAGTARAPDIRDMNYLGYAAQDHPDPARKGMPASDLHVQISEINIASADDKDYGGREGTNLENEDSQTLAETLVDSLGSFDATSKSGTQEPAYGSAYGESKSPNNPSLLDDMSSAELEYYSLDPVSKDSSLNSVLIEWIYTRIPIAKHELLKQLVREKRDKSTSILEIMGHLSRNECTIVSGFFIPTDSPVYGKTLLSLKRTAHTLREGDMTFKNIPSFWLIVQGQRSTPYRNKYSGSSYDSHSAVSLSRSSTATPQVPMGSVACQTVVPQARLFSGITSPYLDYEALSPQSQIAASGSPAYPVDLPPHIRNIPDFSEHPAETQLEAEDKVEYATLADLMKKYTTTGEDWD